MDTYPEVQGEEREVWNQSKNSEKLRELDCPGMWALRSHFYPHSHTLFTQTDTLPLKT